MCQGCAVPVGGPTRVPTARVNPPPVSNGDGCLTAVAPALVCNRIPTHWTVMCKYTVRACTGNVSEPVGPPTGPCISDLGSSARDLGAFFVVGILSHPATRMRSGSKINNTCHPHATVPECCAQADLPVRCTRRRTRVPPFLMRPANFCLFLTPFGSFEHLPHLLLPHPC